MHPFDRISERIYSKPSESAIPRLVVIDGCNIARSSCGLDHLDVVVFLPVIYNNNYNFNTTNAQVLPKLQSLDVLTFTPARSARAGRPAFINYDDLYVLEFAKRHGGNILSGDRFEDIAKEHSYKDFRRIIKERRIDVIFRPLSSDFVYYGRDRFFRFLPELCVLHDNNDLWPAEERIQQRLYCLPNDKDYNKVVSRRELWTTERRDEIICTIDALFDEIVIKNCLIPKIIPIQTSCTKDSINNVASVKCAFDCKETHPEELTRRWLSPPTTSCKLLDSVEATTREKTKKQRKLQMVSRNAITLSSPSTRLLVTQSKAIAYDTICTNIISRLDQIFDRPLIVKILRENRTRDLHVIANLCAQQTL